MRIHLIAVGTRMPDWVNVGYGEFAGRMPRECRLHLVEIAAPKRGAGNDTAQMIREEGVRTLAAVPKDCTVIALDAAGTLWSTEMLAQHLRNWLQSGADVAFIVGGADGLAPACRARAEMTWSLSPLTLPHMLVRIVLAEQLYRAWTILKGHPYHRA